MLRNAVIAVSAAGIIAAIIWHGSIQVLGRGTNTFVIYDRLSQTIQSCFGPLCTEPEKLARD